MAPTVRRLSTLVAGRRRAWWWLGVWLAVLGASMPFALRIGSVEKNGLAEFLPAGSQSARALQLDRRFPSGRSLQAEVVFGRAAGLTASDLAIIQVDRQRLQAALGGAIGRPSAPLRSPDGKVAVLTVAVHGNETAVQRTVDRMVAVLGRGAGGLHVAVTGEAAIQADLLGAFSGADVLLLAVTGLLVAVLLAATYRSPILWLLPLLCVGVGEAVAQAVVFGIGQAGVSINGESAQLVTVMVFGAGTDYALLLTARYREELRRRADERMAMMVAWRRSAPAIVASGLTVVAGLACLLPSRMSLSTDFGIVGMIGVTAAMVVMLGAYPALLLAAGRRVFWPSVPRVGDETDRAGAWARLGVLVSRGRRPLWLAGMVVLGVAAVGVSTVDTNVSTISELSGASSAVQGYRLLAGNFPAGEVSPVDVVVTDATDVGAVRQALGRLPITASSGPVERADGMARYDLVLAVRPTGHVGFSAVRQLRSVAARVAGNHVVIGGQTAEDEDTAAATHHDTLVVVPAVLLVELVVLGLLLRAALGPLIVVATVVLTFAAALGVMSTLVVPALHLPGTDPAVPLLTFVVLVALGTDYTIFLLTRAREEMRRHGPAAGMGVAVASTGGVLTSAGLVLAGTFAVLAVLPVAASREIGIVVAIGVLVDTFMVRTVLLPTLAADLGGRFWWPTRSPRPAPVLLKARLDPEGGPNADPFAPSSGAPGDTVPGGGASDHGAPGHGAPGHELPGHGAPGHELPGHGAPGHGPPDHGLPGHGPPDHEPPDHEPPTWPTG